MAVSDKFHALDALTPIGEPRPPIGYETRSGH